MAVAGITLPIVAIFGTLRASADDVRLDLGDTVELKVVVDSVAAKLGLNLIYDDALLNKKVSLRLAAPVAKDQLLDLLRMVLRSRGLALISAEQPGWLKIVSADQLASETTGLARSLDELSGGDADVLTLVIPVMSSELEKIKTAITPYLTKPGGAILIATEARALVITDYVRNLRRIGELVQLLDRAEAGAAIERIKPQHQGARELVLLVQSMLAETTKSTPLSAGSQPRLHVNPVTGEILVFGTPDQQQHVRTLVAELDRPVERRTELYQPRYLGAERFQRLIEQLVTAEVQRVAIDAETNTVFITASTAAHTQIAELVQRFDAAPSVSATPMRFYKLTNRRADDVFATLGSLLGGEPMMRDDAHSGGGKETAKNEVGSRTAPVSSGKSNAERGGTNDRITAQPIANAAHPMESERDTKEPTAIHSIQGEHFSLSLDEHTNSIIAIATPEMHQQIEQLILQLDKRRPQVLVEVTFISISADNSLSIGAELETLDIGDPWGYLLFTSFGLSDLNSATGARKLRVAPGGTGVLLAPDEVPIILNFLQNRGDTRVYSAPRILVDDNASGRLESVAESPYSSVNASNTVATTSFAGFAKAGTQVSIEPHIAEGDHLEIDYTLTVSSFTGSGSSTTPPPRSSDTITSTIRVPDGHTVIVGGLLTETLGESSSQLPLFGDIPVIGWLFGNRNHSNSKVRLYAFIRPTILRDDGFEDLKYLSSKDLKADEVPDGFPPDRPQYMP